MHIAYIGLGSNLGDREENLNLAVALIKKSKIQVEARSSIYETQPQGVEDQPWFLNMVARVKTGLGARELLRILQGIEDQMGRKRVVHWGPRVIDLDVLVFDQQEIHEEDLEIPHPRMTERAFVLVPLLEIAPDVTLPGGKPVKEFLSLLDPKNQGVSLYKASSD